MKVTLTDMTFAKKGHEESQTVNTADLYKTFVAFF